MKKFFYSIRLQTAVNILLFVFVAYVCMRLLTHPGSIPLLTNSEASYLFRQFLGKSYFLTYAFYWQWSLIWLLTLLGFFVLLKRKILNLETQELSFSKLINNEKNLAANKITGWFLLFAVLLFLEFLISGYLLDGRLARLHFNFKDLANPMAWFRIGNFLLVAFLMVFSGITLVAFLERKKQAIRWFVYLQLSILITQIFMCIQLQKTSTQELGILGFILSLILFVILLIYLRYQGKSQGIQKVFNQE